MTLDTRTNDDCAVSVSDLWAGDRGRPHFLHTTTPTLSWAIQAATSGWTQTRAEVELTVDGATSRHVVEGQRSQRVAWPFAPLPADSSASVRVRVTGSDGSSSELSEPIVLRTGPRAEDWSGEFVTSNPQPEDHGTMRARRVFEAPDEIREAVLSVTAHGAYQAFVNGRRVGDEEFAPGWTPYEHLLTYQSYDVTDLIEPGAANVLGAFVADGWFGEEWGFSGFFRKFYEGPLALSAQLRIVDGAGDVSVLCTDEKWMASTSSPIVRASIYHGEDYDARLEDDAFTDLGGQPDGFSPMTIVDAGDARLEPASSPPIRATERIPAQEVLTTPSGATVVDFGQNLAGWVELTVEGASGDAVTLRFAEVLEDGELGTRPLRTARATDTYVLREGHQVWSPRFTYHGFRYVEVSGWPGTLDPSSLTAVAVHSDMVRTGHLTTSNSSLNRLHENVVWGMRSNFFSVPTDCPQRDERLGWSGDAQVFTPTASYLYDVSGFMGAWLQGLALEQEAKGGIVPLFSPAVAPGMDSPIAAWGDAATLIPDALWERYADLEALRRQYPSMRAWVERVRVDAGDDHLWMGGFQLGDWLDPSAPPNNPVLARTHSDIVASAYYFRSVRALARAASLLENANDAAEYEALAEDIRAAFLREFVTPSGRMVCDAHTAYALALEFGIIEDPELRAGAAARLADLVRSHGYLVSTGFLGTPHVTGALSSHGYLETAYRHLLERRCPSWLYAVDMGATTIWERWDSMLPDGSINPGGMTSFNHYSFGAVADWMHRVIGGISPGVPGSAVTRIAPQPGGGLTSAEATLDTGYGIVRSAWTITDGTLTVVADVPANTTALLALPGGETEEVGSGRHTRSIMWAQDAPRREPYSLDTPLAEIVDDEPTRSALLALLDELRERTHGGWNAEGRWRTDVRLRDMLGRLRPEKREDVAELLASLEPTEEPTA